MAASRSVWKGFIQFSMVSIPVKAYNGNASGSADISLNQLHKECNSRIAYKKTCPVHGEIPANEIVRGYEFSPGQYVILEADEIDKLRTPREKAVTIEAFIPHDAIEPSYYSGKTYYLVPDGPVAFKAYTLIHRVMGEQKRYAFARVSMSGRMNNVLVRPLDKLLAMTWLSFDDQVKKPEEFTGEVGQVEVSPQEVKLAKELTDNLFEKNFDLAAFKDDYAEQMTKLIEAKVAGKEIVMPEGEEPLRARDMNLVDALLKSLETSKKSPKKVTKPPKHVAPGTAQRTQDVARKRKSS